MKKYVVAAALSLSTGLMAPSVYAQLPGLSGGASSSESSFSSEQNTPTTEPPQTSTPPASPSKPKKVSGGAANAGPNTAHTLEEVMFKVSRAQINLEQMGSDYNGHGAKAIEYLKKAMEELQAAKQSS